MQKEDERIKKKCAEFSAELLTQSLLKKPQKEKAQNG